MQRPFTWTMMAQPKAAHAAADVAMSEPDIAAELHALVASSSSSSLPTPCIRGAAAAAVVRDDVAERRRPPLVVIGHRGKGMNALASPDPRLRGNVRENTLRSLNAAAASHPTVTYVEFDVQHAGGPGGT